MTRLVLGVLLLSFTHFIPAAFTGLRTRLVERLGENPYKGIFVLLMAASFYLLISGWKTTVPETVYLPPAWGRHATALLTLIGMVLFFAPYSRNNIRRVLRHPQLSGVILWGIGHLLANGEGRSIVLFGGLALWAAIEIFLINRRDGAWRKPERAPVKNDAVRVVTGIVAFAIMAAAHQWLFGFSPFA